MPLATFVEDKQRIASPNVAAQNALNKDGVPESLINIMEAANQPLSGGIENQKYAGYVAKYMTVRKEGQSHAEAIGSIQAILRSFGTR